MPLYNFECTEPECKHQQPNKLVKMGTTHIECEKCGGKSEKSVSYMFASTGLPNGHNSIRGKIRK